MNQIHLDRDHLQLLDAVARTGSLAQLAVLLGLTKPALSYRLNEAKRRLGAPLFAKAQGRKVADYRCGHAAPADGIYGAK